MASVKGHGQNQARLTNYHTYSDSYTHKKRIDEVTDKTDFLSEDSQESDTDLEEEGDRQTHMPWLSENPAANK